jgi:hypothetical protein
MRKLIVAAASLAALVFVAPAQAGFATVVKNISTGFEGGLLASGAQDTDYSLTQNPAGANTYNGNMYVKQNIPSVYLPNSASSQWISPELNGADPVNGISNVGLYKVQIQFDLTGFGHQSAMLSGLGFMVDNTADVYLNGSLIASQTDPQGFRGPFTSLGTGAGLFVSGINTLEFWITNDPGSNKNPVALRVDALVTAMEVPEPASLVLGGLMVAGAAMRLRRKARA